LAYGAITLAPAIPGVISQPRYIVELLPDLPAGAGQSMTLTLKTSATGGGTAFRITAMGWGKKQGTQVMLQSVYLKR
jgi:Tfp pilus assembly protein PilX